MPSSTRKGTAGRIFTILTLFAGFLLFYGLWLWPLPVTLSGRILFYTNPGDALNSIWSIWWWKHASDFGKSFSECPLVAYPFGVRLDLSPAQPLLEPLLRWSSLLGSEISAYNLWILVAGALGVLVLLR